MRIKFQMPGSKWVWLSPNGVGTLDPDQARRFESREAAQKVADSMTGPTSSLKVVVTG